jgi:Phage tail sheath C-terminal domain
MSEVITETILPGTYIEVRAEGLLTIGAIATGNIGIIGTAERGDDRIRTLSSFQEGRAAFGEAPSWDAALGDDNLSLVRALKLLFDNGAQTVFARRVFNAASAKPATYRLGAGNAGGLMLQAKTPGTWGNRLQVRVEEAESQLLVPNEELKALNGSFTLSAAKLLAPAAPEDSVGNVVVEEHGLVRKFQLRASAAAAGIVQVNPTSRALTFPAAPGGGAEVFANYWVPQDSLRKITFLYGNVREVYTVPSLSYLVQRLQDLDNPSNLVDVVQLSGDGLPAPVATVDAFAGGDNGSVSRSDFQDALEALVAQDIQILAPVGWRFSQIKGDILGHVEKTENIGRERLAILGADAGDVDKTVDNANAIADKRVVLVVPGLAQQDPDTGQVFNLPPYYTAAAVAGKLSSLAPHVSLTNKTLASIDGLSQNYNYGELKTLVQNRVLALQEKRGFRVVKGITTDDEAFQQITLRRIVDYVKQGTRIGANQYIGKLNNRRVRGNLETTLNSFLADLVLRELLTDYKLTVFADRAMEIRGEVLVTMDLMPTFSIDVIRVVMNLS